MIDERSEWRTFGDKVCTASSCLWAETLLILRLLVEQCSTAAAWQLCRCLDNRDRAVASTAAPTDPFPPPLPVCFCPASSVVFTRIAGQESPSRLLSCNAAAPMLTMLLLARCPQDGGSGVDPNRVGGPVNHLLSDGGMSTMIGGAKGVDHGLVGAVWQGCCWCMLMIA